MKRYKPLEIGPLNHPVMIVGQAVGKQRKPNGHMWVGNKTADFMKEILNGRKNIVLTNVLNKYKPSSSKITVEELKEAKYRLLYEIQIYEPSCIVMLGDYANRLVEKIDRERLLSKTISTYHVVHPSFILRFHYHGKIKDRYAMSIRYILDLNLR